MDTVGNVAFENNINQLGEAIRELSRQVQELQQSSREEAEKLEEYREEETSLEFILVTGGLIKGELLWVGNQSIGVRNDSGQIVILYKHAIAFIQKQTE
jgi:sRNA-binding regulator protein Hfq